MALGTLATIGMAIASGGAALIESAGTALMEGAAELGGAIAEGASAVGEGISGMFGGGATAAEGAAGTTAASTAPATSAAATSAPMANNLAQAAAPQAPAMDASMGMTSDTAPVKPANNTAPAPAAEEKGFLDEFKETEFGKGLTSDEDVVVRGKDGKIKWGDTLSRAAGRQASNYVQGAGSRSRQRAAAGQEWVLRSLRNE
jgi:hypothetical protein